jgi:transposase
MFFRNKKSPSGQCLQLIEAYRAPQGQSRNRVVVSLGKAHIPPAQRPLIAQAVQGQLYHQGDLFQKDYSPLAQRWIDAILQRVQRQGRWQPLRSAGAASAPEGELIDGVLLDQVDHTHTAPLGPSLVGWEVWNRLQMPQLLAQLGLNPAQRQAAAITVIGRLVNPGSERALWEWLPHSSLPELMGLELTEMGKDRFYRISDGLLKHQSRIEAHLRQRQARLFERDRTILLYDLTNSYFEGQALQNPKARRGKSKEKRHDCPQVVIGMVFDRWGCELTHKVFEGTQADGQSLLAMIEELKAMVPESDLLGARAQPPMVVLDAGVATRANLRLLRQAHLGYLVNESRRSRATYQAEFEAQDQFQTVAGRQGKAEVKVRLIKDPHPPSQEEEEEDKKKPSIAAGAARLAEGGGDKAQEPVAEDYLVLCRSQGRRDKEQAIRSQSEERYLKALEKLAQRVARGRLKVPEKIERAIGRLQRHYSRIQRFYTVKVQGVGPDETGSARVVWERQEPAYAQDDELLGDYVLRTNRPGKDGAEIWKLYIMLTEAEGGFRALKSELGLRPNYHQLEERVDGHVFITVLAYHLLWYVREKLEAGEDYRSWRTIKGVLSTHSYTTLLLPTKAGTIYRVRRAGQPEEVQKAIYRALEIGWRDLPMTKVVVGIKEPKGPGGSPEAAGGKGVCQDKDKSDEEAIGESQSKGENRGATL